MSNKLPLPRKIVHVELDPDLWHRGDEEGSMLLNPETGKMCCWGFAALALGATRRDILGESALRGAFDYCALVDRVTGSNQYSINDGSDHFDEIPNDHERIALLNQDARENHIPVRFYLKGEKP